MSLSVCAIYHGGVYEGLTHGQDQQKNHHVATNHEAPCLRGRNLRQIQRHHDRQQSSSQTTPDPREQQQTVYPRCENLDERPRRPHQDCQTPCIQPAQTVVEVQREQRPEGCAQHVERGYIGLAVGEAGGIVFPIRRDEVVVGREGVEFDAGTETSFIVTCSQLETYPEPCD